MSSQVVETSTITLENSDKKAIVVAINRPNHLNCFNTEVAYTLARVFSQIADSNEDELAAVIFTGRGKSFCAGADLSNPPDPLEQSSDLPECLANNPVYQMSRIKVPLIGAIHGHVITGGFELALACDILVGDATTKFRDTHVKFGLAPCWGLSQKLQQRVGPGRAKLISYSARPIGAKLAYEWGLIDEIVSAEAGDESSLDRAITIADDIGGQDLKMVTRYKKALTEGGEMELGRGLQRERQLGIAHYLEAIGDGATFLNAKNFISDEERPRMQSKL
uniref:Enoyl-CoA hydratase n=1 Tax=Chaetoceros debilis TaxID=122233 RepID=A0A7S3QJU4_9STRA|mmetsp:Transcript_14024/g.20955  ORF Transcript_14024/g.20955 Transcript_14024/m.20955 type:complete len:278 (+) Transcript_14024:109-942(+)